MPGEGETDPFAAMKEKAAQIKEAEEEAKKKRRDRAPSILEGSRRAEAIRTYKKAQQERGGK